MDQLDKHLEYSIAQDLNLKGGRIWLPLGSSFIPSLLTEYHSSPIGGHMGAYGTQLARFLNPNVSRPHGYKQRCSIVLGKILELGGMVL